MCRFFLLPLCLLCWVAASRAGHTDEKSDPNKVPPAIAQLLQGSAEEFIKRFDRNRNGYLSKDELPPRLANLFDKFDRNGDGKLDRQEVELLLKILRQRLGQGNGPQKPAAKPANPDRMVAQILERMDANKDGRISREEARGPLAKNFDQIDTNKDGCLDRDELRRAVGRFLANRKDEPGQPNGKGGAPAAGPQKSPVDFDALDLNADGRLTREELKGTPFESHFGEIDANKDGKIDRKEFEAYLKRQSEKKD